MYGRMLLLELKGVSDAVGFSDCGFPGKVCLQNVHLQCTQVKGGSPSHPSRWLKSAANQLLIPTDSMLPIYGSGNKSQQVWNSHRLCHKSGTHCFRPPITHVWSSNSVGWISAMSLKQLSRWVPSITRLQEILWRMAFWAPIYSRKER